MAGSARPPGCLDNDLQRDRLAAPRHYGRGADRIRTLIHQDTVMTTLEDFFTTVEHKMVAEGAFRQVREARLFQDWMAPQFIEIVSKPTTKSEPSSHRSAKRPTSPSTYSCPQPARQAAA